MAALQHFVAPPDYFSKSFLLSEGDVGCAWGPMLMLAPLCGWNLSLARFSIDLFLFAGNAKKGTGVYRVTARIRTTDTRPSTAFRGPFSPPSDSWRRTTGRVSTSWWVPALQTIGGPTEFVELGVHFVSQQPSCNNQFLHISCRILIAVLSFN